MPLEVLSLFVYLAQQFGVVLGVGAQSIVALIYLHTLAGAHEYGATARQVRRAGVWLMAASGVLAAALHIAAGQWATIVEPAYIAKWVLIALVFILHVSEARLVRRSYRAQVALQGLCAGAWYALFMLHAVAPIVTWPQLVGLTLAWSLLFAALWSALVWLMHREPAATPVPDSAHN